MNRTANDFNFVCSFYNNNNDNNNNYYYYHYYHYLLLESFSHQILLIVFYWSLTDSKFPQVSRTLLCILAVLNNVVVWIISTRPLISKSSNPINNALVTESKAPITIVIIVTFMFHSFFQFPSKAQVLILLFPFVLFYSAVSRDNNFASSHFVLIIIRSGILGEISWSVFYVKDPWSFMCVILQDRC